MLFLNIQEFQVKTLHLRLLRFTLQAKKGGGLWGYYHTTFNRERQVMQFAKAGDDCEPKSLKAREDGTLDSDGEADFCRIQWSTRYTLW